MIITAAVHNEPNLWRHLFVSLADCPTHLRKIRPDKPTWIEATDASLEGMGGVCHSPTREWHFFRLLVDSANKRCLLTDTNSSGELTIKT